MAPTKKEGQVLFFPEPPSGPEASLGKKRTCPSFFGSVEAGLDVADAEVDVDPGRAGAVVPRDLGPHQQGAPALDPGIGELRLGVADTDVEMDRANRLGGHLDPNLADVHVDRQVGRHVVDLELPHAHVHGQRPPRWQAHHALQLEAVPEPLRMPVDLQGEPPFALPGDELDLLHGVEAAGARRLATDVDLDLDAVAVRAGEAEVAHGEVETDVLAGRQRVLLGDAAIRGRGGTGQGGQGQGGEQPAGREGAWGHGIPPPPCTTTPPCGSFAAQGPFARSASNRSSSRTCTPSDSAFSSFEPGSAPATT
ncbi:MAG: hypothetical protein R2991_11330 [Thermoanaerobaculia bacterium]